jgi:adenine-specific DNA-methyltransferase
MNKKELLDKVKSLDGLSTEEKAYLINLVNTKKKYGLVWEDKQEDVEEQLRTHLPVLKEVKERAIINDAEEEKHPNHILIEGDNFHSLTSLTFTHNNSIDFIYADPPYNTGAKDWTYNNDYVDSEDPYRHSKWLSFMHKRLKIAKSLLKDDGIICVTIDDYEMPRLWTMMEELFGTQNHLGTVVIRINPKGRKTKRKVSLTHEYALFFGKSQDSKIKKLPKDPRDKTHNYKQDKEGNWYLPVNLRKQGADSMAINKKGKRSDRYYPIYLDPETGVISTKEKLAIEVLPIDNAGNQRIWRRSKEVIDEMYETGELWSKETKGGHQIYFKFKGGLDGEPPQSIWYDSKHSASEYGTKSLDQILGKREVFQYPKSPFAVETCIRIGTKKKDATILDFFAGSGTTIQSTININNEDNGKRKVILCTNNENNICEEVTYKRASRVINGYINDDKEVLIPSKHNNLRYYKTDFVERETSLTNKRKLTQLSTELLCIKEDCYTEVTIKLEKVNWHKFFTNGNGNYVYVIYDDMYIEDSVAHLSSFIEQNPEAQIKVYVFANGPYPYTEEFESIAGNIELAALPDAIYKAYQNILPKQNKEFVPELEEESPVEFDQ